MSEADKTTMIGEPKISRVVFTDGTDLEPDYEGSFAHASTLGVIVLHAVKRDGKLYEVRKLFPWHRVFRIDYKEQEA